MGQELASCKNYVPKKRNLTDSKLDQAVYIMMHNQGELSLVESEASIKLETVMAEPAVTEQTEPYQHQSDNYNRDTSSYDGLESQKSAPNQCATPNGNFGPAQQNEYSDDAAAYAVIAKENESMEKIAVSNSVEQNPGSPQLLEANTPGIHANRSSVQQLIPQSDSREYQSHRVTSEINENDKIFTQTLNNVAHMMDMYTSANTDTDTVNTSGVATASVGQTVARSLSIQRVMGDTEALASIRSQSHSAMRPSDRKKRSVLHDSLVDNNILALSDESGHSIFDGIDDVFSDCIKSSCGILVRRSSNQPPPFELFSRPLIVQPQWIKNKPGDPERIYYR